MKDDVHLDTIEKQHLAQKKSMTVILQKCVLVSGRLIITDFAYLVQ
jgi:hypothetical protein